MTKALREQPAKTELRPDFTDGLAGHWWLDLRSGRAGWDAAADRLLGGSGAPGSGDLASRVLSTERPALVAHIDRLRSGAASDVCVFRAKAANVWLRSVGQADPHGARLGLVGGRVSPADSWGEAYRMIVQASSDFLYLLDENARILFAQRPDGANAQQVVGTLWPDLLLPESAAKVHRLLPQALGGEAVRFTLCDPLQGGTCKNWDVVAAPVLEVDACPRLISVSARDMSYQKRAEERATWLAKHDSLTNLPNRLFLQTRLDRMAAEAGPQHFGLLLIDIDDFKQVNDTLGHDAGDYLLRVVAKRLRGIVGTDHFLARLGSDEFAMVSAYGADAETLKATADAIERALQQPVLYTDGTIECRVSIGGALFPLQGENRTELMKHADIALYAAKSQQAGYRLFASSMREAVQKRLSMLSLAKSAVQQGRILPHYQPQIELATGRATGFEALLRWHDHAGRLHAPAAIAAAFDDAGLGISIGNCIIGSVVAQMRDWLEGGLDFGHVAVNATAAQFRQPEFAERLLDHLAAADVPTSLFQLEVTETVFLGRGAEHVESVLRTLSAAGITIALDDFGTGFASLSHLKQFPVDVIKVDCSFVEELGRSPDASAIVQTVINLGRSLNIAVVAEGIETRFQEELLRLAGCDYGQGYLYSRALPGGDVPSFLSRRNEALS